MNGGCLCIVLLNLQQSVKNDRGLSSTEGGGFELGSASAPDGNATIALDSRVLVGAVLSMAAGAKLFVERVLDVAETRQLN